MNKIKRYIVTTVMALAMVLPIIQPLVVHAEETTGQVISVTSNYTYGEYEDFYSFTLNIKEEYPEIVGYYTEHITGSGGVTYVNQCLKFGSYDAEFGKFVDWSSAFKGDWVASYNAHNYRKKNNDIQYENHDGDVALSDFDPVNFITKIIDGYYTSARCTWSGIKVFETREDAENYVNTGSTNGLVEEPKTGLEKGFYLKNVSYRLNTYDDNSVIIGDKEFEGNGTGGVQNQDNQEIIFSWDTDNLQDGDLIEIKTHNYYKTLTGEKYSGFYDYKTYQDGISAMTGTIQFKQSEPSTEWFGNLENKPIVHKNHDTDIYYFRPYRNGVWGMWTRVTMGKMTPSSPPYVQKVDYGDINDEGEFVVDSDITASQGGEHGFDIDGNVTTPSTNIDGMVEFDNIFDLMKYWFSNIGSLVSSFGQLPQLINNVIGWLPSPIIVLICGFIALVIILRIFGR